MSRPREIHERIDALSSALEGELISFLDYLTFKDAELRRQTFDQIKAGLADLPEDEEGELRPEFAARLEEAKSSRKRYSLEELGL